MTLYSSKAQKSEIAFTEAMKQAGIEVILTDVPWGEWECMVNTTEHDKEVIRKFTESLKQEIDYLNENGGGIGDLYFWLEQMKEGGEND